MQHVVERPERHELADDAEIRRLVARREHGQDVGMVEDAAEVNGRTEVNRCAEVDRCTAARQARKGIISIEKRNRRWQNYFCCIVKTIRFENSPLTALSMSSATTRGRD